MLACVLHVNLPAASKEHLQLGADEEQWPKPTDMQTAWAMHAYMMARIVMNIGFNGKVGDGDVHDAHHYASACYADIFVTEDGTTLWGSLRYGGGEQFPVRRETKPESASD